MKCLQVACSIIIGISFIVTGVTPSKAATLYIPDDYPDLRTAYDAADSHDTLIVRPGYYSGDNWTEMFYFDKPVRVIGEGGPAVTTLDGRGIDIGLHFRDLPDDTMLVEGFTITNCVGQYIGAVNFHENSRGTLRNCIIENCRATEQDLPIPGEGGGLRIWGASPVIEDVIIRDCHAMQGGGCNILDDSSPIFRRVRIENCSGGALMSSDGTNPYFEDCQFINNTESIYSYVAGVGIYIGSQGHFVRCLFQGNRNIESHGGGVNVGDSSTVFDQCVFIGNTADGHAGGVMCAGNATPVFNFCTIVGNSAGGSGDGIGVFTSASPTFNNCIIWQPDGEIYSESGGTATFNNCDISAEIPGSNNFSEDPMFFGSNDYHLQADSPCRNRGDDVGERIDIDLDWVESEKEIWDVGADEIFTVEPGEVTLSISMPVNIFHPGDPCFLNIDLENTGTGMYQALLVVVLDAYGEVFFWPSWNDVLDKAVIHLPGGSSRVEIIPEFLWPDDTGTAQGVFFHSGILGMDMMDLVSNIDSYKFGWTDKR